MKKSDPKRTYSMDKELYLLLSERIDRAASNVISMSASDAKPDDLKAAMIRVGGMLQAQQFLYNNLHEELKNGIPTPLARQGTVPRRPATAGASQEDSGDPLRTGSSPDQGPADGYWLSAEPRPANPRKRSWFRRF
jgi:hypothetical protein